MADQQASPPPCELIRAIHVNIAGRDWEFRFVRYSMRHPFDTQMPTSDDVRALSGHSEAGWRVVIVGCEPHVSLRSKFHRIPSVTIVSCDRGLLTVGRPDMRIQREVYAIEERSAFHGPADVFSFILQFWGENNVENNADALSRTEPRERPVAYVPQEEAGRHRHAPGGFTGSAELYPERTGQGSLQRQAGRQRGAASNIWEDFFGWNAQQTRLAARLAPPTAGTYRIFPDRYPGSGDYAPDRIY